MTTTLRPDMTTWTTRGDGVDALRIRSVPRPVPGPHQVLVRISAVSLNYRDLLVVGGVGTWSPEGDLVPVSDGTGVVVDAGESVTRFAVGDRVSAMFLPHWRTGDLTRHNGDLAVGGPINPGMLADYVLIDEESAATPPRTLDDAEAATLPIAAITAWHAIVHRDRVAPGDTILIHGTGGVALFALQFALALGARVAVTSSSDAKLDLVRALGAEIGLNYRTSADLVADVLDWTGGEGVDHVVETVGGANLNTSLRAVRIGGSIRFIGLIAGLAAEVNVYEFVTRNVTIHGIETGSREMYEAMAGFIDAHGIRPVIDSVHTTDGIDAAFARLTAGPTGKVVITLGGR